MFDAEAADGAGGGVGDTSEYYRGGVAEGYECAEGTSRDCFLGDAREESGKNCAFRVRFAEGFEVVDEGFGFAVPN